ncbi:ArsR/SmtB family transcription factor [Candidatus Viridilinea mediisalina]|uniref:Transcriptional regulator n=1 Tax=Candidatus Viridilinea mediisalina TaxID=2024553 RepID=A0A2A6RIS2_9CHLR|nr:metalloregulator ArsR/SmtB family transcription factor [Candidatus Viridilinea mediisalina]PDW02785.1 transcriptional regulator [Candidatus Viridilinea mediisalina]
MLKATTASIANDVPLAQLCKALGNPVRIAILRYVLEHPDCIGNQILLHLPDDGPHAQSTLSQHLRQLRDVHLLESYSDGAAVCYRVNSERLAWLRNELGGLSK